MTTEGCTEWVQNRDALFPTEGLRSHENPLRPLCPHLSLCHPPGRYSPLLVMSSDPDGPLSRTGVSQGTGGSERVEDRKVLSGIIHVIQQGLRWVDAPGGPVVPTKPSTTVAAADETRVFLS